MRSLPRQAMSALLVSGFGCATPISEDLHVASDTGGMLADDGLCGNRNAGIGSPPVERADVALDCLGPGEDRRLTSCSTASMRLRFADGGMTYLNGLSELRVEVLLPDTPGGYTWFSMQPTEEADGLPDGLQPELRLEVPAYLTQRSLQVVPEESPDSCNNSEGCGRMGIGAVDGATEDDTAEIAGLQHYPLGSAASGVLLLEHTGWDEDPVVLELEVPFFAPDGAQAMTCPDGLIHYDKGR